MDGVGQQSPCPHRARQLSLPFSPSAHQLHASHRLFPFSAPLSTMSSAQPALPEGLAKIVAFFEGLSEDEKRENLINYADKAARLAPQAGDYFDLQDVRKDQECTDTVGVFLRVDEQRRVHFRVSLGPEVQTLTRAMAAILCKAFEGATVEEVLNVPHDFIPRIVGTQLVRARSQTSYYILTRMKGIVKVWLQRERELVSR